MKASILLADHDPELAEATMRRLLARGYDVQIATDAIQCHSLLRSFFPEVLVLDLAILWGGGDGVLEWLIEEEAVTSPAVAVIANRWWNRIPERLKSRVDVQIQRPESMSDLVPFVSQLESLAYWSQSSVRVARPVRPQSGLQKL